METIDISPSCEFGMIPADIGFALVTNSIEADSIKLKNVVVPGDIIIGTDGDPNTVIQSKGKNEILGRIGIQWDTFEFPSINMPPYIMMYGILNAQETTLYQDTGFVAIDLPPKGRLYIDGDITLCVTDKITLGNGAQIVVKRGSSLKLYLGCDLDVKNSNGIINENVTEAGTENEILDAVHRLTICATDQCSNIILNNKTNFYGVVYAPDSNFQSSNNASVYGEIIAKNITLGNSTKFYRVPVYETPLPPLEVLYLGHWREELSVEPTSVRLIFETLVRKSEHQLISDYGRSLELHYYDDFEAEYTDRFAEIFQVGDQLVVEHGVLISGTLEHGDIISSQVITNGIADVEFYMAQGQNPYTVEMNLKFTDGTELYYSAAKPSFR